MLATAAFLVVALLAACSGDDDPSSGSDASDNTTVRPGLTVTDDGCTYEGDKTVTGPSFTLNTDNQSSDYIKFGLSRIPDRYVDVERERFEEGEAVFFNPPSYFTLVEGGGIGAGISGSGLMENVTPGVYALWCATDGEPTRIFVAALLEASD